jgi:hypothetical protein
MVYFLKLVVSRDLHHTTFASVLDIILILASSGLLSFYFALAIINRPETIVYMKAEEIKTDEARGLDYDDYHCLCQTKSIPFEQFIIYSDQQNAIDEAWCQDAVTGFSRPIVIDPQTNLSQTGGRYGGAMCVTSEYKLRALLRSTIWRFSRDNIVTNQTLRQEISTQIDLFVFDIWNIMTDNMKITQFLMQDAIGARAINGSSPQLAASVTNSYNAFLNVEYALPALRERLFKSLDIRFDIYLRRCEPYNCYRTEKSSVDAILLSAVAIVGGNLALFTAFGNAILKYVEDRYLAQLFQKYLTGQITEQEKEFLTANSPHMATLVDDDPKGLPPGTTLNDLRRIKSKNPGGAPSNNVQMANTGPTPI